MENYYEALIGPRKQSYYLEKFRKWDQEEAGLRAGWNWSALFFTGLWALYRKMYIWFLVWFVLFPVVASMVRLGGTAAYNGVIVLGAVCFAIFANSLYHRHVKDKISATQKSLSQTSTMQGGDIAEVLRSKGGVNRWVIWVCVAFLCLSLLAPMLLPIILKHAA